MTANKFLGRTVTDKITGFSGVVTGYVEYISGCNQVLVVPKAAETGALNEAHWFDEQRLDFEDVPALTLENVNPGFDKSAPKR